MIDINTLSDQEIVREIINRDVDVTKAYFYRKCYPLFMAIYNKYYTDCDSCIEFINEIYVYLLTPGIQSGKSPLSSFSFRCTLTLWLKLIAENYCKQLFKKRLDSYTIENDHASDRKYEVTDSLEIDLSSINLHDIETVIALMPNKRYQKLIHLRYVEDKSNEETANLLGMSMDNYYNKHLAAKKQYCEILRKEGLL